MADFLKDKVVKIVNVLLEDPIEEEKINWFLGLKEWIPSLKKIQIHCGEDELGLECEYQLDHVPLTLQASVRVAGVKLTPDEKVLRLAPQGPIKASTDCHEIQITFKPGPSIADEWKVFASFLPASIRPAIEFSDNFMVVKIHKLSRLNEEINKKTVKEVLGKKIAIFDYITIKDIKIKPSGVQIITG